MILRNRQVWLFIVCISCALIFGILSDVKTDPLDVVDQKVSQAIDERDRRENCRLLSIVSRQSTNPDVLATIMKTFGQPSYPQDSGWSIAAYSNYQYGGLLGIPQKPMILRSHVPIMTDQSSWQCASEIFIRLEPSVLIGHLRNASSGCSQIADPHPFEMSYNGLTYLMTHNGGVWDKDLDYLIDSMITSPKIPQNCPGTPIDSEYLFIYLMQLIEEYHGDVWTALSNWAESLIQSFDTDWNALNVILTDGHVTWAVRISYKPDRFTLHYSSLPDNGGYAVSTQALEPDWIPLPNYSIAEFSAGNPVYIETIPHPILRKYRHSSSLAYPFNLNCDESE